VETRHCCRRGQTVELVTQQTIGIPRIVVVPKSQVVCSPFTLELRLNYPAVSDELWVQHLR
jgi:type III restriction enzyme